MSGHSPYEGVAGFSRAVVAGDRVYVAGTAPIPPDGSPVPEGAYEHLTVTAVVVTGGTLELKGTRTFPVVAVVAGCQGVEEPRKVAAWEQEVFERLVVPSPLMLAAPAGTDPNLTVSGDRTSFSIRTGAWTWTFTPTLVA